MHGRAQWLDTLATHSRATYLACLVFSAMLLRSLASVVFSGEIDTEGAEYSRIAENLLAAKGYSGIAEPGTQLFAPPLFPFLIAGLTWVTGDAFLSGLLLGIVAGSLLVVPVFLVAEQIVGPVAARVAGALTAVHPYLIRLSSTTVSLETVFLAVLTAAVYCMIAASIRPTLGRLAALGASYAAAYLLRPEALIYLFVGLGFVLLHQALIHKERLWPVVRGLCVGPLVFLLIAGPYIVWLSMHTGSLRFEGKSPLNIQTELRKQQGLSMNEAAFAVDAQLTPRGVWNQPNIDVISAHDVSLSALAAMLARKARSVVENAAAELVANVELGSPALFALAVLGLFGRPWAPGIALHQLHLMILAALSLLGTFFIYYTNSRFYVVPFLLSLIWASVGLLALKSWAEGSCALWGLGQRTQRYIAAAIGTVAVAAVLLPATAWSIVLAMATKHTRPIKDVAISLSSSDKSLRIADTSTPFAFHAAAEFTWLPYSDESTAKAFLHAQNVSHIVLRHRHADERPYLKKWLTEGVPEAKLVAEVHNRSERVQIFTWHLVTR